MPAPPWLLIGVAVAWIALVAAGLWWLVSRAGK